MKPGIRIGAVNAATPTPLTADCGFDADSAARLCCRWIDIGLDGVLLLGTMGEGPSLPEAVRDAFVEFALAETSGRLTLFASAFDLSRARMMSRARRYAAMGADCVVLCLTPGVPVRRAAADVLAVAEACEAPCAFYDTPAVTGTALLLEELLPILEHDNIVACKDSSGNALLAQALTSAEYRPDGVTLLDGNEYHTAYSALLGYDGVLHGGGVLTGRWVRAIWDAAAAGRAQDAAGLDREKALFLAQVYNRFSRPLQNTVGQKYALAYLGCMDEAASVAIDQRLDDAARGRIRAAVDANRKWLV